MVRTQTRHAGQKGLESTNLYSSQEPPKKVLGQAFHQREAGKPEPKAIKRATHATRFTALVIKAGFFMSGSVT
ncbi:MAG: hypothetical protein MK130_05695, partial [Puniceicoccaceae bacterium]|nr:hypothetical protein [Puniceicoccaceae bacterium]